MCEKFSPSSHRVIFSSLWLAAMEQTEQKVLGWQPAQSRPKSDVFWIERSRAVHRQNTFHRDMVCKTSTHINASLVDSSTYIYHTFKAPVEEKDVHPACMPACRRPSVSTAWGCCTDWTQISHHEKCEIGLKKKSNKNVIFLFLPLISCQKWDVYLKTEVDPLL